MRDGRMKLQGARERRCVQKPIGSGGPLRLHGVGDSFDERGFGDTRAILGPRIPLGRNSLRSPQTRLCRRHEQQSRAQPLNAEIRSGAVDGAEIHGNGQREMNEFLPRPGRQRPSWPFPRRSDLRELDHRSVSIIIPRIFLYRCPFRARLCNSVISRDFFQCVDT